MDEWQRRALNAEAKLVAIKIVLNNIDPEFAAFLFTNIERMTRADNHQEEARDEEGHSEVEGPGPAKDAE